MGEKVISIRKLALLLLLASPPSHPADRRICGMTRLQKLLFLVSKKVPAMSANRNIRFDFGFEPESFGPADTGLYADLDFLVSLNHIKRESREALSPSDEATRRQSQEEATESSLSFEYLMGDEEMAADYAAAEREEECFSITDTGVGLITKIESGLDKRDRRPFGELRAAANEVRATFGKWPLQRLLRHVYSEYPEMTAASEIKSRVLGRS